MGQEGSEEAGTSKSRGRNGRDALKGEECQVFQELAGGARGECEEVNCKRTGDRVGGMGRS